MPLPLARCLALAPSFKLALTVLKAVFNLSLGVPGVPELPHDVQHYSTNNPKELLKT